MLNETANQSAKEATSLEASADPVPSHASHQTAQQCTVKQTDRSSPFEQMPRTLLAHRRSRNCSKHKTFPRFIYKRSIYPAATAGLGRIRASGDFPSCPGNLQSRVKMVWQKSTSSTVSSLNASFWVMCIALIRHTLWRLAGMLSTEKTSTGQDK